MFCFVSHFLQTISTTIYCKQKWPWQESLCCIILYQVCLSWGRGKPTLWRACLKSQNPRKYSFQFTASAKGFIYTSPKKNVKKYAIHMSLEKKPKPGPSHDSTSDKAFKSKAPHPRKELKTVSSDAPCCDFFIKIKGKLFNYHDWGEWLICLTYRHFISF